MNFRILIPYWGREERYQKLLYRWFDCYAKLNLPYTVTIISDENDFGNTSPYGVLRFKTPELNKNFPFDHKGNIVCAAIQVIGDPVLVLDTDAILQGDPGELLSELENVPFAMPEDEGARGRKIRNRHAQEMSIPKRCAGVLWFGAGDRNKIVDMYRAAFKELETGRYYEERRLYEQHAWTMVAHQLNAPFLSRLLNWPDHISSVGPNPKALIYHRVGQRKFNIAFTAQTK
jgi:hypothetical protein